MKIVTLSLLRYFTNKEYKAARMGLYLLRKIKKRENMHARIST